MERKSFSRPTRLRAYRLDSAGSSFSYFADGEFVIIEGRLNDASKPQLLAEMRACGVSRASRVHITSWDQDHCSPGELGRLLALTAPRLVECPGYPPETDCAKDSLDVIRSYHRRWTAEAVTVTVRDVTPSYIGGLGDVGSLAFKNIYYHPRYISPDCSNDNSTVALFRRGIFNVLSLGDLESPSLSKRLSKQRVLRRETDVMILAHHGADNGFTDRDFIRALKPRVAICSSDRANQHDHPRDEIRRLLHDEGVQLCTTKDGDVVVRSLSDEVGTIPGYVASRI